MLTDVFCLHLSQSYFSGLTVVFLLSNPKAKPASVVVTSILVNPTLIGNQVLPILLLTSPDAADSTHNAHRGEVEFSHRHAGLHIRSRGITQRVSLTI